MFEVFVCGMSRTMNCIGSESIGCGVRFIVFEVYVCGMSRTMNCIGSESIGYGVRTVSLEIKAYSGVYIITKLDPQKV